MALRLTPQGFSLPLAVFQGSGPLAVLQVQYYLDDNDDGDEAETPACDHIGWVMDAQVDSRGANKHHGYGQDYYEYAAKFGRWQVVPHEPDGHAVKEHAVY